MSLPTCSYTVPFCLEDLSSKDRAVQCNALANIGFIIAQKLNERLDSAKVDIYYTNILSMDPDSSCYNPDGLIGRFHIYINQ